MTKIHNKLLEDICLNLLNCADCHYTKNCNPAHKLRANAGLIITGDTAFYIEPYSEKINASLIKLAKEHGYNAGVIKDHDNEYIEFVKTA